MPKLGAVLGPMRKLLVNPRVVLPIMGTVGLLAYVGAPCWLPIFIVERLDFVALGFALLVALPWLILCFEEIEIGGVKAKLRSIEEQSDAATATAHSVREMVDELTISRRAIDTDQQRQELPQTSEAVPPTERDLAEPIEKLRELSRVYVTIRGTMSSGAERTTKMTEIFGLMEGIAKNIPDEQGNIVAWLSQEDPGNQIAAIAWLRSHQQSIKPAALIDTIDQSNQPFVQYWALRVLHGHVDRKGVASFTPRDLRRLQALEEQMRRNTDRWYQLCRINEKLATG